MAKYDDKSFGKAFAAARKELGAGKTFTWKGKSYSTNLKEESGKASGAGSQRPKARPKTPMDGYRAGDVTTSKISPAGGRGDGGAERVRRAADAAISRATAPKASTGGPARMPRGTTKPMTNADRMEAAKAEAAARREKTRRQAGIGGGGSKPKQVTPAPNGKSLFQTIGDFLAGGGYAGYKARQKDKNK